MPVQEVEIFVSTIGQHSFGACMEALQNQDMSSSVRVIKNVQPMNEAFNTMIRESKAPFFVQVDEDMVLYPNAIRKLYNVISASPKEIICVCFDLWDSDLKQQIQGVKIYRSQEMKQFRFLNKIDCEMNIIRQWREAGFDLLLNREIIGTHESANGSIKSVFLRYKMLAQKELYGFNCMTDVLQRKIAEFLKSTEDQRKLFAVLGLIAGYSVEQKMVKRERGIDDYNDVVFRKFQKYFAHISGAESKAVYMDELNIPTVSVVFPIYKKKLEYLREAIDSILNQSFADFELLLVLNGSPEEVVKEVQKYEKRDKRVKVLHIEMPNLVNALNHGIRHAKGKYIARQDGDDASDPQRFLIQTNFLDNNPDIAFVGSFAKLIDEEGNFVRVCPQKQGMDGIREAMKVNNTFTHGSIMIRAEILKQNNYSTDPAHLHIEDYELWYRLIFGYGMRAENLDLPLYYYRLAHDGVCRDPENSALQRENCRKMNRDYTRRINRTYASSDLMRYKESVDILHKLWSKCKEDNIPYNIDGLDNKEEWKPRFWEYSHGVEVTKIEPGIIALDAGSGYSLFPGLLAEKGCKVYSLDVHYQEERQYQACKLGLNITADKGSFLALPYPDGFFDLVFCVSCLEHLQNFSDVEKAMAEFCRVLKPKGKLFLTVDYHKNYIEYGQAGWEWSTHTRYYDWQTIQDRIISPSGFKLLGNDKIDDLTDWSKPPLYGHYTFASVLLEKNNV